ncbi:hypothetical protein SAMN05443428_1197 [Caloramator quimbayensis]|uniref:CAAX protease self-immunity n=1 Tax=Caloramator quimbayensis TaxID=1147123 RepID=A0A1T4Y2Z7_9CLOT|nr:hypothetical protein [Caloramator quimbayensis]SKA95655.1 hypothetical protein SAMN05443428_1197 [Caloramator quimbayensis]
MFIESTFAREEKGIRVFAGILLALLFPFAARGLMDVTGIPFISSVIYWLFCGIILRLIMGQRLPYFRPQFKRVWIETLILFLATAISAYFYIRGSGIREININLSKDAILNIFAFSLLNGCFEQLVWMNIYELAGAVYKSVGVIFSFIFVGLIHAFFWTRFMPSPGFDNYIFIASQAVIFVIPFIMYIKTKDITIWSIQHIIYNLFAVLFANFTVSAFMHIK